MASAIDAFNEALNEDKVWLKVFVYAIPIYLLAKGYLTGKSEILNFYAAMCAVFYFSLLTVGINNVRKNRCEIITFNPFTILKSVILSAIVLIPYSLVCGIIGNFLTTKFVIPVEIDNFQMIYTVIVWAILGSIVLTAYLSFAKYMKVSQGFNYKLISESCIDVLLAFLLFIPQLAIANLIIVGPVFYLYFFFNLPFDNFCFVAYCSGAFVINLSIVANYFAQIAYEYIKGSDAEYEDNIQLHEIDSRSDFMK